jgi:GNAT superfamily N-acetyltransferase
MAVTSPCDCGLSYSDSSPDDVSHHDRCHDHYLHGYPFHDLGSRSAEKVGSYVLLDAEGDDPRSYRKQFAQCAMVAHRETPRFKAGYYAEDDERSVDRRAFALLRDGRAVALLIAQREEGAWAVSWHDEDLCLRGDRDLVWRWLIQRVWVARQYRGRGLGTALTTTVSARLGELAWEGPFTAAGQRLLRRLCPGGFRLVVGSLMDLPKNVCD